MKTIFTLGIFLVLAATVQSQENWGPPFPLTDSLTDNLNATLSIVPADMIQPDTLFMLWERSSDTSTTEIYARNLTTMAAPFLAAGLPGAHFRHPVVYRRGFGGDTLFFFSYETDMNGNWDIYYSIMMRHEVTLGPFPFITSPLNDRSIHFGDPYSFSWETEGIIKAYVPADDTSVLCSEGSSGPVQSGELFVAYEKPLPDALGLFFSKFNPFSNIWDGPYPMDINGTNTHATFGNDSYAANNSSSLLWQHKDADYWTIKGFDLSSTTFLTFNNFPGCNNLSPSFCSIEMLTDSMPFFMPFSTFSSDVTGNMETYVNMLYDMTYQNISQYTGKDAHPQLFNNLHWAGMGLDNQLFDIWESSRGGHWQLWATTMDVLTGENTLPSSDKELIRCYPNPSASVSRIEFRSPVPVPGFPEITDLSGKKITQLTGAVNTGGLHTVEWNGTDAHGNPVPAGIYFCSVKTGETVIHCKIIRR
jgi:hypothetical protein